MKLECALADVCLPDYWRGHHLPHVCVPVYRGMKLRDLKAAIKDELRQGAVAGNTNDARLLSADMVQPWEEKQADRLTRAAYAAVNRIQPARKGAKTLFRDLDEQPEDCESVYAYFVFVEA